MVVWPTVHRPKELEVLCILDLRLSSIALQTRWLCLQQADESRAWAELPLSVPHDVESFFEASTYTIIGDDRSTPCEQDGGSKPSN